MGTTEVKKTPKKIPRSSDGTKKIPVDVTIKHVNKAVDKMKPRIDASLPKADYTTTTRTSNKKPTSSDQGPLRCQKLTGILSTTIAASRPSRIKTP